LLVDLFTAEAGLVTVVARSARGLKSRFQGQLQLFKPLWVAWTGRNELKTLVRVEANAQPYMLPGQALLCGFYVNELLLRLLDRQEALVSLFTAYKNVLEELVTSDSNFVCLRYFEIQLLEEVGYGLPFYVDAKSGDSIEKDKVYFYEHQSGFCEEIYGSGPAVRGATLYELRAKSLNDTAGINEAKLLMRYILSFYLGGKSLKSREMFT
tara:strand:- start:5218 stop:5847 length:630 start_codon:yes stop_codon:yes gene_type:complete